MDAPNLDTVRELRGRSRLFLEDDPHISVEDGPPTSVEYEVVVSTGGAFAWRYYGDQAMDMIGARALTGAMNKPTAPPEGFVELQQQLKSIATDLASVRNTLEQQSAANHDQLTRIQEQVTQQSMALLSSSPLA